MRITRDDYLKANRKASREEEIREHGHPIRIGGVHKSKKVYNRKRSKAEMKKALPYFFVFMQMDFYTGLDHFFVNLKTVEEV